MNATRAYLIKLNKLDSEGQICFLLNVDSRLYTRVRVCMCIHIFTHTYKTNVEMSLGKRTSEDKEREDR